MANILGGIATSHTPTIGFAVDTKKQDEPSWSPIFEGYAPMKAWLEKGKADVIFYIFNDHMTSFFIDHYSHFALGVGETYPVADEGGGPRDLPPLKGHPEMAAHIAQCLTTEEFDLSYFQDKALDHGCFSPLSAILPYEPDWPAKVIPLQIGVLQSPSPTAARCFKLGQALGRAIRSFPEDLNVVIASTGGLSHQVHGERCGFNNTEWDMKFMELLEKDPQALTKYTIADLVKLGGAEGAEIVMWLVMRGALNPQVRCLHKSYYLPSMTGIASLIFEPEESSTPALDTEWYNKRAYAQLEGLEDVEGTYPLTLKSGVRAYRINKFLHQLIRPEFREAFLNDFDNCADSYALTDEEKTMIRERDWQGMIRYGVIFFMLEKLGAVTGVSNLHIYAAMRGQTIEEFQQTRNAQVTYSVAGKEKLNKFA